MADESGRTLNVDLLKKVLEYIKTHPQQWRQSVWFKWTNEITRHPVTVEQIIDVQEVNSCGSAFCFAGHTALMTGFVAPPKENHRVWADENGVEVDDHARIVLGLTLAQASVLFDPSNTMEDLEIIVDRLIENPKITTRDLVDGLSYDGGEDEWYDEDDEDYDEE